MFSGCRLLQIRLDLYEYRHLGSSIASRVCALSVLLHVTVQSRSPWSPRLRVPVSRGTVGATVSVDLTTSTRRLVSCPTVDDCERRLRGFLELRFHGQAAQRLRKHSWH